MSLEIGSLVNGRYRIERILGQGGMGAVYAAIDENLGIPVALKENLFTTEEYARQFRREATILATLRHPNLPRVTDHFVIAEKGQYLVMDYIDGEDLRHRLESQGASKEEDVVDWSRQICEAVRYLHSQPRPILHRDIKPSNIRITSDRRAVLVDFGLAKMAGTTTTVGPRGMTPGFAPPEQYGGAQVDTRADIYALAATLYMLLTGAMPEDGLDRAMGYAALTAVRTRNPKVSDRLAKIVERGLEVKPEDRFQSIDEFAAALTPGATPAPLPASDATRAVSSVAAEAATITRAGASAPGRTKARQGSRLGWVLGGGTVVAALLAGIVLLRLLPSTQGGAPAPSPTEVLEAPTALAATLPPGALVPGTATLQPAGKSATPAVILTATGTVSGEPVDGTAPAGIASSTPAMVSGGGTLIAFTSERAGLPQIFLMHNDGTDVRQLTTLPDGACQPDWSPDGKRLAFTSPCKGKLREYQNASIYLMNVDGSGLMAISTAPGGDFDPAWSPDGKKIAISSLQDGRSHIFLMDPNGNNRTRLSALGAIEYQPRWSPDGTQLLFLSAPSSGNRLVFSMAADGTAKQQFSRGAGVYASPDWSRDGKLVLFVKVSSPGTVITTMAENLGFVENPLLVGLGGTTGARFSPDGQWIVADAIDAKRYRTIWRIRVVGGGAAELTFGKEADYDPAWQPVAP